MKRSDWWNNALLGVNGPEWSRFSEGYKRAARILVEHAEEKQRDQDFIIFPFLFLCRHYIELQLKNLIRIANDILFCGDLEPGLSESEQQLNHHKLEKLWTSFYEKQSVIFNKNNDECLDEMKEMIFFFQSMDPSGTTCRYPEAQNQKRPLDGKGYLNIKELYETFETMSFMLEGAYIEMQGIRDSICENLYLRKLEHEEMEREQDPYVDDLYEFI